MTACHIHRWEKAVLEWGCGVKVAKMNKKTFEEMAGTWLQISEIMLLTDKLEKVCKQQKPPMTVGGHVHAILKEKIEAKANADATTDSLMGAANSSTVPAARKSFRSELDIHKVANSQHIHLRRSCELPIFLGGFRSTAPKFQRANLLSPCMLTFAPTFMTESYPAGIVAREL